jgi:RNA recognition motif-containing protein
MSQQPNPTPFEPYKRIRITNLPKLITREHVFELCFKFGKVLENGVQVRKNINNNNNTISNFAEAYVSFLTTHDAEFAIYRLQDYTFQGFHLHAFPAPFSAEEKEERKKDKRRTK